MQISSREFNLALAELLKISHTDDRILLRRTALYVLRRLAQYTPRFKQIAQALYRWKEPYARQWKDYAASGWSHAWRTLAAGGDCVTNSSLPRRARGEAIDQSQRFDDPFITLANEAGFIEKLNEEKKILARALEAQAEALKRSVDKIYTAMLRGKSG